MDFIDLIKKNYKENIRWYIIIWILLLIPVIFCIIQPGYSDVRVITFDEVEKYHMGYYNLFLLVFLFVVLSIVVITSVFILSKRNNKDLKHRRLYVVLSLLFYSAILLAIMNWCGNVTVMVHPGSAVSHFHVASHRFLPFCLFYLGLIGIYSGFSTISYCLISRLNKKGDKLYMILSLVILSPVWVCLTYLFSLLFIFSML